MLVLGVLVLGYWVYNKKLKEAAVAVENFFLSHLIFVKGFKTLGFCVSDGLHILKNQIIWG